MAEVVVSSTEDIVSCFVANAPPERQSHSHRTSLELVEQRIKYLRGRGVEVGPRILVALAELLTADLVAGNTGNGARFRWLLELITEYQGHEEADRVARVLSRWRIANSQAAKRREAEELRDLRRREAEELCDLRRREEEDLCGLKRREEEELCDSNSREAEPEPCDPDSREAEPEPYDSNSWEAEPEPEPCDPKDPEP